MGKGWISHSVHLNKYEDADGKLHGNISEMPIIVLRSGSNGIRKLRQAALERGIKFVDFINTMSVGTYAEEYAITKSKKDEELDYWAIILFGPWDVVSEMTRKLSLYK